MVKLLEHTEIHKRQPLDYLPRSGETGPVIDTTQVKVDDADIKGYVQYEDEATRRASLRDYTRRENSVNTLLLDPEDQDESIQETLGRIHRFAFPLSKVVGLVGIVSPEEPEDVSAWAKIHQDHSASILDDKIGNIVHRLREGSVLVVATSDMNTVRNFDRDQKVKARMASWDKLEAEVTPEQKARNNNKYHAGSSAWGQYMARRDWNGSLGGGPLKVGGIVNQSPK